MDHKDENDETKMEKYSNISMSKKAVLEGRELGVGDRVERYPMFQPGGERKGIIVDAQYDTGMEHLRDVSTGQTSRSGIFTVQFDSGRTQDIDGSELNYMERYSDIPISKIAYKRDPEKEVQILESEEPYQAYWYVARTLKDRWPEAESLILTDPGTAFRYAATIIKGRWPEAEPQIMKEPDFAVLYAKEIIKGRWPEAEPFILEHPNAAYKYALWVIKGRWPEAEPIIATHPFSAHMYAERILKNRWPEAEPAIKTDRMYWNDYQEFLREIGKGMDIWQSDDWD